MTGTERQKLYANLSNEARAKLRQMRGTAPTAQQIEAAVGRPLTAAEIAELLAAVKAH